MGFSAILVTIDCALVIIVRYREHLVGFTRIHTVGPHHPTSRLVDGPTSTIMGAHSELERHISIYSIYFLSSSTSFLELFA